MTKAERKFYEPLMAQAAHLGTAEGQAELKSKTMHPYMELSHKFNSADETKNLADVNVSFKKVMEADPNSPSGKRTILMNAIRAENPGKPVGGQDLDTMMQDKDILARYGDMYNSLLSGGMTDKTANDLKSTTARAYIANYKNYQDNVKGPATAEAEHWGVPKDFMNKPAFDQSYAQAQKFVGKHGQYVSPAEEGAGIAKGFLARAGDVLSRKGGAATARAQGTPKVGAVQDGYRFMGGDPSNPKSWKKAQ